MSNNATLQLKTIIEWASDAQLANRYSVSRATIWRWAADGRIPQPIKLSPGCTRWKLADLASFEQGAA